MRAHLSGGPTEAGSQTIENQSGVQSRSAVDTFGHQAAKFLDFKGIDSTTHAPVAQCVADDFADTAIFTTLDGGTNFCCHFLCEGDTDFLDIGHASYCHGARSAGRKNSDQEEVQMGGFCRR